MKRFAFGSFVDRLYGVMMATGSVNQNNDPIILNQEVTIVEGNRS